MLASIFITLSTMAIAQAGLPQTCRSVVRADKKTPLACVLTTRIELSTPGLVLDTIHWGTASQLSEDPQTDTTDGQNTVYNDLMKQWVNLANPGATTGMNPTTADANTAINPDHLPGACRWDYERSNRLGSEEACMCPATESTCTIGRSGCWWYEMAEAANALSYSPTFACINTAERFYHLLSNLLKKRGKKDFAIKIRYGATPARGSLPYGPFGPAIIGGGSNYHAKMLQKIQMQQQQKLQQQKMMSQMMGFPSYGGLGPWGQAQQQPYGQSYGQAQEQPQPSGYAQQHQAYGGNGQQSFTPAHQQQPFGHGQHPQSHGQSSSYPYRK